MEDSISDPSMEPHFFSVDPVSLLFSKNSDVHELRLIADGFSGFERGPRYGEYARLREAKLRVKRDFEKILAEEEERFFGGQASKKMTKKVRFRDDFVISPIEEIRVSPERKQPTRFGFKTVTNSRKSSASLFAQSVPDFSAVIRKENRRPKNPHCVPRHGELTPPPPSSKTKNADVWASSARGSKSESAGEKKKTIGLVARKSYANVEDLKRLSMAAASAINDGGDRRKAVGGCGRTILGYRQLH